MQVFLIQVNDEMGLLWIDDHFHYLALTARKL